MEFLRPNFQEDIDYRENQLKTFIPRLKQVISPNLDLRFHGTPIYFAEQIIKNRGISSTADRYDSYMKSTDPKGSISATTIDTISRTISFFTDMASYQRSLPCGCVFALLPRNEEDAKMRI